MPTTQVQAGIGWEAVIGIGQESTAGTAVAPTLYLPCIDANPAITNMLAPRSILRNSKGQILSGPGQSQAKSDFTVEVNPTEIGLLLGLAMGADAHTGPTGSGAASGTYTHVFTLASPLNTFTMSVDLAEGTVHQYTGNKVDQLDISCKGKQSLQFKVQTLGIGDTPISSSLSPSFTSLDYPLFFENISSATINGLALYASDFSISLKNNIKPTWYTGSGRFPGQMNETECQVSGSMTVQYAGSNIEAINALVSTVTPVPISIVFQHATVPYGMTFTLPNCIIETAPIAIKKTDIMNYAVKFSAFESSPGSKDDLTVTLLDKHSAGYVA